MDIALKIALISLIGTIIGSGSITAIVNTILSHKGKTAKQLDRIESRLDAVDLKVDRNEARGARSQILRFADEIYQKQRHTKEHFDEILAACQSYNTYCENHPEFENMRTLNAQRRINDVYYKCLAEHSFLDNDEE